MKLRIMEEFNKVSKVFINHYDDYNLIHHSKVDQDNMFIVVEKFFFRNSSRASLSIVLTNKESYCEATIIGSGGGQGMIFKFDWGAANSFQQSIKGILERNGISFTEY